MTGKTHMSIGIVASIGISALYFYCTESTITTQTVISTGLFATAAAAGSLLPDVDYTDSTLSRRLPPLAKALRKYYTSIGILFGDTQYQQNLQQHRGICHSLSALLATFIPLAFFIFSGQKSSYIFCGLLLGMLLHILADSFTPVGTMLLAPFSTKHYFSSRGNSTEETKIQQKLGQHILLFLLNLIISVYHILAIIAVMVVAGICIEFYNSPNLQELIPYIIGIALFAEIYILLRFIRRKLGKHLHPVSLG